MATKMFLLDVAADIDPTTDSDKNLGLTQGTVAPPITGETIETIDVEKRDAQGLLERLVKRTTRK